MFITIRTRDPPSSQFCLEKGVAHHLIELESPSPKDDLCQVLLKLVQRFCADRKMEGLLTIGDQNSAGELKSIILSASFFRRAIKCHVSNFFIKLFAPTPANNHAEISLFFSLYLKAQEY